MRTIIATIIPGKLPALPWTPTSYVVSDLIQPPKSPALPVTVIPIDPMVKGRPGVLQNNWRLVMNADALFLDKRDDHLYRAARLYGLAIYAPLYDPKDDIDLFAAIDVAMKKPDEEHLWGKVPEMAEAARVQREAAAEVDLFAVQPEGWGTGWQAGPAVLLDEADLFGAAPEPDLFAG